MIKLMIGRKLEATIYFARNLLTKLSPFSQHNEIVSLYHQIA